MHKGFQTNNPIFVYLTQIEVPKFPFFKQLDAMDCGPTCLRMVAKHYGKSYSLDFLRDIMQISREGVSFLAISDGAEKIGFRTLAIKTNLETFQKEIPLPAIMHWEQKHFVVVHKVTKKKVFVADPAYGLISYEHEEFKKKWYVEGTQEGMALLFEPTQSFYDQDGVDSASKTGFKFLINYVKRYKRFIFQLGLGFLLGSILQLIFPFLTQSIVDFGINYQDIDFVYAILCGQLMLFISRTSVDFIRSWILLHIGTRININIISDFLIKLMKLPISFFDTKMIGDILQRIGDHQRIESFLTNTSLNVLFGLFNLVIFGAVLWIYNFDIFLIFLIGTIIHIFWINFFMKKRSELDHKKFEQHSENQNNLIQLVNGMPEIKLNNCERQKRWDWENIQARLFKVNVEGLALNQYQQAGALFITELKNILISFYTAKLVIEGEMTLGMMLAVQYIIGQLNAPIGQLIGFAQAAQDAKLSLERIGEIHEREDEEKSGEIKLSHFPEDKTIRIKNLGFSYEGHYSEKVLNELDMEIPQGKLTAIVGSSGSGKTTLLKLLLRFYLPTEGDIRLGDHQLDQYDNKMWRQRCGVVMQEGFLFSDTILNNITFGNGIYDKERFLEAVRIANIRELIESLPLGYQTKIGSDGHGLSTGQKQRILIARAVYKNPEYLFFDEATSALDAKNEKVIMENLEGFFQGKTAVVIAHRLSTVKNADQIVVLERGKIVEKGDHKTLTDLKGVYYNLVKNQLELGN